MRFSLKWMLAAVAFVGFVCVALYNANEVWAMAAFGFTLIVLLVALVGAFHSKSFYIGVAVFGWGYLVLAYVPQFRESVRPVAATDALLDVMCKTMQRDIAFDPNSLNNGINVDASGEYSPFTFGNSPDVANLVLSVRPTRAVYRMPIQKHFRAVGHSLFALVFGLIGGAVGRCFSRTKGQ